MVPQQYIHKLNLRALVPSNLKLKYSTSKIFVFLHWTDPLPKIEITGQINTLKSFKVSKKEKIQSD